MANTTTSTGIATSFTKTPQANDDSYMYDEDLLLAQSDIYNDANGILSLNVMSNDLGGGAKTLFSVADGAGNPITDFSLLNKDALTAGASAWEQTTDGNWIRINNGKIDFALGSDDDVSGPSGISINSLGANATIDDTFVLSIRLGNGTLSQATVSIKINGNNDAAAITADPASDYDVTEAGGVANGTPGDPSASGKLTVVDLDAGESVFQEVEASSLNGSYGTFTFDPATGEWTYTLNETNPDVEALNTGSDPLTDCLTVTSLDGTASEIITVSIKGSNDAAIVSSAVVGLTETNAALSTGGTLTSDDVDNPDNTFTPSATTGVIGDFSIDAAGVWNFTANSTFDQLNTTDSVTETYNVTSIDGTPSTVKITITGSNDAALVSSAVAGLTETNAVLSTGGTLTSDDVDNPDNTFTPSATTGVIGDFSIDAAGAWTFTANSTFDYLNTTDFVTETYNLTSVDGTPSTVKITITGSNDAAVLSSAVVSLDETNVALTTGGTLTNSDVDNEDTFVPQAGQAGDYGTFGISEAGVWSYIANSAFNSLNVGESVSDTFSVAAVDGTLTSVKVTINGTNDIPVISGETAGDRQVKEESDLNASGTLTILDADAGQSAFTAGAGATNYGSYTLGSNGVWSYLLNNANTTVQALGEGVQISDSFVAVSQDGTASKTVMITITGTADGPVAAPVVYNGADPNDFDNIDDDLTSSAVNFTGSGNTQDTVHGSNSADTIIGNNGADTIYGNGGNDALSGGDHADTIYGGSGVDTISGGNQSDTLYGGSGSDMVTGNAQPDDIFGGSGNDTLNGNEQNDVIIGGFGADLLTGGTGSDKFSFLDIRDTGDTITDFSGIGGDADKIDFSAIDANPGVSGNDAFGFAGQTTTLSANSLIWFISDNGTAGNAADDFRVIQVDTDGNIETAEMQIQLTGVTPLVVGDFIF